MMTNHMFTLLLSYIVIGIGWDNHVDDEGNNQEGVNGFLDESSKGHFVESRHHVPVNCQLRGRTYGREQDRSSHIQ